MKKYSKEELAKIVLDCSNTIMQNNSQTFIEESLEIAHKEQDSNKTMIDMLILIYTKTQQNCCDIMTEVLSQIIND